MARPPIAFLPPPPLLILILILLLLLLLFVPTPSLTADTTPGVHFPTRTRTHALRGDVSAVYSLLDRVLPPGSTSHFNLALTPSSSSSSSDNDCGPSTNVRHQPCFALSDSLSDGRLSVTATSASELTAGIGHYLRVYCNVTIGWPRGGGSNLNNLPPIININNNNDSNKWRWPKIGPQRTVVKSRNTPLSYLLNVCAHSYSLVWYSWSDWQTFIDWLALSGINLILATTGQEEVQYKVFRKLGLDDATIRGWFNGPALLTWSRGQNEYGSGLLGPLPRSWMVDQWNLQRRRILPRLRGLGIIGQLPGFQGNVPVQLRDLYNDTNITIAGETGWMDSLDPLFGTIADLWMETLIEDFGTDHWYQMDGYFDGGTAPWWAAASRGGGGTVEERSTRQHEVHGTVASPSMRKERRQQQRQQQPPQQPPPHTANVKVERDVMAYRRATAAYTGLNRTDPDAIWSFQGWAVYGWSTPQQAAILKGFVDSVGRKDKFVIIDMDTNGQGQYHYFNDSAFFGAPFVWTALHNFGGTDGMKGNLAQINRIPFDAIAKQSKSSNANVIGTGATPEGIDQNPIYYEFIFEQNFRDEPVADLVSYAVDRAHRRYGLSDRNEDVTLAWTLLADSAYAVDLSVQDGTGIAHLPPRDESPWFEADRRTPKPHLCKIYASWRHLIRAAEEGVSSNVPAAAAFFETEPFRYDLVNTGREVLANLATPAALNFSDATARVPTMDREELSASGKFYIDLLDDVDRLVGTDKAFLLGSWIQSARLLGAGRMDCASSFLGNDDDDDQADQGEDGDCERFLEWNARTQLTTWKPTPKGSASIPGGPIDYAAKHWNGLIGDYYGRRAQLTLDQALRDESAGRALDQSATERLRAEHAYEWTTSEGGYPVSPVGDAVAVSRVMHDKYERWFAPCGETEASTVMAA